jgi:drug/metabolite transporter (DMT)-like permease
LLLPFCSRPSDEPLVASPSLPTRDPTRGAGVAMSSGVLLGSAAAIAFALTDFLAALISRRIGSTRAVLGLLITSTSLLVAIVWWLGLPLPSDMSWYVRMTVLGVLFAGGYLALVQALQLGPLSVVSPVTACFGASTVILAVLFLGERPSTVQLIGVATAVAGSILASVVFETGAGVRLVGRGPLLAVVAVVASSFVTVALREPVREGGWAQSIMFLRLASVLTVLVFMLGASRRASVLPIALAPDPTAPPRMPTTPRLAPERISLRSQPLAIAGVVLIGLFDTVGFAALAVGLQVAPAWMIGVLTSTSPVFVMAAGLVFFKEHLTRIQWIGMGLVAVSVVAVGGG